MRYYKCRTPDGAVLWQEITDDGASVIRLLDENGDVPESSVVNSYSIESTDPELWLTELLPAAKQARLARLQTAYEVAVVRDYPSAALGAVHTYPSGLTDKLYMNARVTQALVVKSTVPFWQPLVVMPIRNLARPAVWNGWIYICSAAGTTGAVEPSWPVVKGEQVRDGMAVWMAWEFWTGQFLCKNGGEPVRRSHSPEEIIQVGMEGAAFVQVQLDRYDALSAQIEAATDIASLDQLNLIFL